MTFRVLPPASTDEICTVQAVDASGAVLGSVSAVARAEVHIQVAETLSPAEKWAVMQQLHERAERELYQRGIRRVWTWFDSPGRFCRRLLQLLWCKSDATLYYRELR